MSDLSSRLTRGLGRRGLHFTHDARSAIELYLRNLEIPRLRVLVPAYYGFSPRDGSGIWDPLARLGATTSHYRLDRHLTIDVSDLERKLESESPHVVIVVHYFGWPDPRVSQVVELTKRYAVRLLEDEAHSLLTCLARNGSGIFGEASAISINKSFNEPGGLLIYNDCSEAAPAAGEFVSELTTLDLANEAGRRRRDAHQLMDAITGSGAPLKLLRTDLPSTVVPHNIPVLVPRYARQTVYETLNAAGFPVACLYYRLGPGIDPEHFIDSRWLSERLVNLPLKHPVADERLVEMINLLSRVVEHGRS